MKTEKNILIAFILNFFFSLFEFFGGIITKSIAITSDAIHDLGDALSIGISFFLERKSKKNPDNKYTYGYQRYSILGAFITSTILIIGSILVIISSIRRIINPIEINYDGMIVFAIIGFLINLLAAYFTKEGDSLNQKSVNLHMLEDVLGWAIVLIGSILMKFTDITYIDQIMSILVALFILYNAIKNLKSILNLFLEKIPNNISLEDITLKLTSIKEITNVHHLHVWSIDGENNYATLHVVTNSKNHTSLKEQIRNNLKELNISHVTIEIESEKENCQEKECHVNCNHETLHHHH